MPILLGNMTTGDSSPAQASRTAAATSAEAERLAELHSLNILDTPSEPGFDALVTLASQVTGCPISLVSLIDEQRQWFKAKVGTDLCSTDRDIAFCDHVVRDRAELEVPDARLDPRFRDNPLVTGPRRSPSTRASRSPPARAGSWAPSACWTPPRAP